MFYTDDTSHKVDCLIKLWNVLRKGDDDEGHITYDSLRGGPSWPRSTQL